MKYKPILAAILFGSFLGIFFGPALAAAPQTVQVKFTSKTQPTYKQLVFINAYTLNDVDNVFFYSNQAVPYNRQVSVNSAGGMAVEYEDSMGQTFNICSYSAQRLNQLQEIEIQLDRHSPFVCIPSQ